MIELMCVGEHCLVAAYMSCITSRCVCGFGKEGMHELAQGDSNARKMCDPPTLGLGDNRRQRMNARRNALASLYKEKHFSFYQKKKYSL